MNLVGWYEAYWAEKSDNVDHDRLDLMLVYVQQGWRVFQLDGGPGMLAERMVKERGAEVILTDLTHEASGRAQAKGLNASQLYIAEGTVKNHVTHILGKLGVRDRTQAAIKARELGLL